MEWPTVITSWPVGAVNTTHFDNFNKNIETLHAGNGVASSLPTLYVASDGSLTLDDENETFLVDAQYALETISVGGRLLGNRIHLILAAAPSPLTYTGVISNQTPGTGFNTIKITHVDDGTISTPYNWYLNCILTFHLISNAWLAIDPVPA